MRGVLPPVGTIDYLNTQPIEYHLEEYLPDVSLVRGVPTAINQALLDGRVSIAPISSYTFALHTDELLLVPGLSIASLGAVNSVLLFSWRPDPHELDGALIALSDHSATSINLLRVLCEQAYHITPEWVSQPQDMDQMMATTDGALIIGDRALFEGVLRRHVGRLGLPYCFDLGDEWLHFSSLPFTFAVWAVRKDCAAQVQKAGIVPALYEAKTAGLRSIDAIALDYAPRLGLPAGVCARYLRNLRYHLDEQDQEGLRVFLRYALPDFDWGKVETFVS